MFSFIVGTAGHIDHGKTSLVRALTGVDADRLPEEKQRGITIDIGFAELALGDVRVGFVDVPGHERFIKNMLAGAHGIDAVLLVVAADEGVMPQTREHFAICRLLGVRAGIVVLTKADMPDDELLELVKLDVAELVAGSFLENAPVVAVSAKTGAGLDELKHELAALAAKLPPRLDTLTARLPIDRAFAVRGFGAVVTGTLVAGEISEGDELELLPDGKTARVRGLQVHGAKVQTARAGQRTAVNLGGIETAQLARGMTLAPPARLSPTQIFDAQIEVLDDAPRALKSRQRVRVHAGASEVLARVRVLNETNEIAPGARGFAQLRLEAALTLVPGERFIVRSYSPQRTIAGGEVLNAHAIKHRGRAELAQTISTLENLLTADDAQKLALHVALAGEHGLRAHAAAARTGWRDETLQATVQKAVAKKMLVDVGGVWLSPAAFGVLFDKTLRAVAAHHKAEPLAKGMARETLREKVFAHLAPEVFQFMLAQLTQANKIVVERDMVRAVAYAVTLTAEEQKIYDGLQTIFTNAALAPPRFADAIAEAGGARLATNHARKILQLLLDKKVLLKVAEDLYFAAAALENLVETLHARADQDEAARAIDVTIFKELTGASRKYAIPLLEYLDRTRVTARTGDTRRILSTYNRLDS